MSEIRVSAKTVDDAITEAAIQLGISSDQIEYDVIEKGSAGFLGIGSKKAVINARAKSEETKKAEAIKIEKEKTEAARIEKARIEKEKKEKEKQDKLKAEAQKVEAKLKSVSKEVTTVKDDTKKEFKKEEVQLAVVSEDVIKDTEKFLIDVMNAMGMEVTVTSNIDEEGALAIELEGANMGILIGKRGQTLDSLQYLANRVANKVQDGYVRVKLDTENYRAKRKATLENLAKNIAYKVKRTKKSVSLEPMNPYERRIIHSVLQSDPYISTHSEGDEPYRRVVITLAKKN
ncbi:MAG: protein jag [Lachnospiraceae bacterium]|nr:protein jag [Lachnospiraceae bacterium]